MIRMRSLAIFATLLMLVCTLFGCGSGSSNATSGGTGSSAKTGAVALQIDLSKLSQARTVASVASAPSITDVKAVLSSNQFGPFTYNLAVSGNTATGRIENLPIGYMHIVLNAYSGATLLYTGSTDVNVVAGGEANAHVLLDPVNSGSVSIDVGLNPLPGYKMLDHGVGSGFYYDSVGGKTYVFDYLNNYLAVYDSEMTSHLKDIPVPSGVTALAFSPDRKEFYFGCGWGDIYRLDLVTGTTELIAKVSDPALQHWVRGIAVIKGKYLLAAVDRPSNKTHFVALDLVTGNITGTYDYDYYIAGMTVNQTNGVAYAQDVNVSPQNIHRIQVDPSSGAILDANKSNYAGTYLFATPLRIIKNGTQVTAASGQSFVSSADPSKDLVFSGSLNTTYHDIVGDDALNLLYLAQSGEKKLVVLSADDFALVRTVELSVMPMALYHTSNSIVVFGQILGDSKYYVKTIKKSDLGLVAP